MTWWDVRCPLFGSTPPLCSARQSTTDGPAAPAAGAVRAAATADYGQRGDHHGHRPTRSRRRCRDHRHRRHAPRSRCPPGLRRPTPGPIRQRPRVYPARPRRPAMTRDWCCSRLTQERLRKARASQVVQRARHGFHGPVTELVELRLQKWSGQLGQPVELDVRAVGDRRTAALGRDGDVVG